MCNDIIEHSGSTRDQGEASCLLCNGSPAPDHHLHTRHCCSYNVPFLHVFAHITTWKYFSTHIALEDIFHPMVIIFTQYVLSCTAWHYWTSVGHDITVPFMYTCSSSRGDGTSWIFHLHGSFWRHICKQCQCLLVCCWKLGRLVRSSGSGNLTWRHK